MNRRTRFASISLVMLASATLALVASVAHADLALSSFFGDHMVLQRGMACPLWGTADAGATIKVTIDGKDVATTHADDHGGFHLKLPTLDAPGPYTIVVSAGGDSKTLSDVLAGDVWVCSGQSNMGFNLKDSDDAAAAIAAASLPNLRLCYVPQVASGEPLASAKVDWKPCTPDSAKYFSAVAYHFGRNLNTELNVPIGLIHTSWGGTPAESWTPLAKLESLKDLPGVQAQLKRREIAAQPGFKAPPATRSSSPTTGPVALDNPQSPSSLYNGMVAPLGDLGIKGVIWYQGETNANRHREYTPLLEAMIGSWREQFGQGDFPFYIVGLANWQPATDDPNAYTDWAPLRDAQRKVAHDLKNVAMTVTIDIGEGDNIHPKNKRDVGRRLALVALADTYGKTIVSRGPTLNSVEWRDGKVILKFDNIGGGLKSIHEPIESFAIAGDDGKFVWGDAEINGDVVTITSTKIAKPTRARYAWADNPKATLFNAEGLPAEPFEVKK